MDNIKISALGGLDENGRDCYVIEINNDLFVVEAGSSLPDKTIPGVDFLLPNAEYIIQNRNRLKAYIITHGHDESMSGLKYFYNRAPAPVYCTETTRKCMLGQANILKVKTNFDFHIVEPSSSVTIANHVIHFFQTCHSVAQSMGVAFETNRGNIVYTSDFIVDYSLNESGYIFDIPTLGKISEKPTLILLSPSKGADRSGYCAPKHRIVYLIEKYFKDTQQRIFISSFWQNLFRIRGILILCKKYHKKVYFYDEYTAKVMNFLSNNDDLMVGLEVVNKEDLLRVKEQDLVILILGHGSEIYENIGKLAARSNEDKRIVIGPKDIFISAALPTATQEVVATRSLDSLYRTGCEVVWLNHKVLFPMHAHLDDLKVFLSLLKPKFYLPVRGSFVNLMSNAKLALSMGIGLNHSNVFILDNGMQLIFDEGTRPHMVSNETNNINISPVLVDGTGISKVGSDVIEERRELGFDGAVVVAATISIKEKKIIAGPDCQMRGFVFVKEAEPLLKSISNIFVEEVNNALTTSPKFETSKVENVIRERAKRFIRRENGREPMILPIIIEV
ncbi:MAG: ribonuclease J [Bacilli bacterium]|nr:ribonuclease J [Bacilli bacterium]MDD3841407.1 ribonuclease J [Bacilli bacterium]HKM10569.1 ribonuclease J [Bacilli bacterium]